MGVGGHRASLNATPRQVLTRIAPDRLSLLPIGLQRFHRHPRGVENRLCSKVSDPLLDINPSVRSNRQEPVHPGGASSIRTQRDPDAGYLRTVPLATLRLHPLPVKRFRALVHSFPNKRTGHVTLDALTGPPKDLLSLRSINFDEFQTVQPKRLGSPMHQRLDHRNDLHAAWCSLG